MNGFKPGEKIILDKAVIVDVRPIRIHTPEWFPMGINDEFSKVNESKNGSLTPNVLYEAFEAEGIVKSDTSYPRKDGHYISGYWEENSRIKCMALGEKHLFGEKTVYFYSFDFYENTIMSLSCEVFSLVKE